METTYRTAPIIPQPPGRGSASPLPPWRLTQQILALSVARTWAAAKAEWELVDIFFTPAGEYGACLCGHSIREHCLCRNGLNGNEAVLGNCCVKRLLGIPSDRVFAGLRRVEADLARSMGKAAVEYAYSRGWIDAYEVGFYRDTLKQQRLTPRQMAFRQQVNLKVLSRVGRTT
jgi:hypothetical protein